LRTSTDRVEALVLARSRLSLTPYRDWLGAEAGLRLIVPRTDVEHSLPGWVDPDSVIAVPEYENSGAVELAAVAAYQDRPFGHLIALSEYDLLRAARLRELLDLPGQGSESARAFRDKAVMKERWRRAGVPSAPFRSLETPADLLEFAGEVGFPVVVKPRTGSGSRSVRVLSSLSELNEWLVETWSVSALQRSNWLAEGFVHGRIVHVDGILRGDEFEVAWPSRITAQLQYVSRGGLVSAQLDADDPLVEPCRALTRAALSALPHTDPVLFHAELWECADGRLLMNEIASREGGSNIPPTIRYAFGVSLAERFVRQMVHPEQDPGAVPDRPVRAAGFAIVAPPRGTIMSIPPLKAYAAKPWLGGVRLHAKVGKTYSDPASTADVVASCVLTGNNHADTVEHGWWFIDWTREQIGHPARDANPASDRSWR
jgi:biotin carboxylase